MRGATPAVQSAAVAKRNTRQMTPDEVLETQFGGPDTGIFTDGSCDPNPGPGGWGWVWVEKGEILDQGHGRERATTNNRMELQALIEALQTLPGDRDLEVYSDSQLCVNTINEWAQGWEKRGLETQGRPDQESRPRAGALRARPGKAADRAALDPRTRRRALE